MNRFLANAIRQFEGICTWLDWAQWAFCFIAAVNLATRHGWRGPAFMALASLQVYGVRVYRRWRLRRILRRLENR